MAPSLSLLTERIQMLCEEVFLYLEFAFMAADAQKEVLVVPITHYLRNAVQEARSLNIPAREEKTEL